MRSFFSFTLFSLSCLLLPQSVLASVLAIDYGTDWMKASLMKPGVPFDVLLNKDSKRKIQSSVAWKGMERLFGTDAFNLASRFPEDSFSYLKPILATPINSDAVSFYGTISTAVTTPSHRQTVALRRPDETTWSVEELVAMQFAYVRDLADAVGSGGGAGERRTPHDVVLTVPAHFTHFQRDALADAVEMAGMRTLALVSDGAAVALNYAMTRAFGPEPEYHVVYDVGASGVHASVVSFVAPAGKGTTVTVLGVGWDLVAGGTELDRRLREILVESFVAKHRRDVRSDKKAMAKLWKESGRVKAILSANTDAVANIESLAFDIDFRAKVTRRAFEDACADLKPRFIQPILDAVRKAGLKFEDISSVILTGGGSRTPMVQAAVKAAVGENKIAQNVNADEAAVLGAAFYGASISRQFRTKEIKLVDMAAYDVQASYFAAASAADVRPRTINTVIFPVGSKTGTKKTLTFKRKEDFSVWLEYKQPPLPGFPTTILEAKISGVAEALTNLTNMGAIDPVIKANVSFSESGFVSIQDAVAFGEVEVDSFVDKLKGFFGGADAVPSDDKDDDDDDDDGEDDDGAEKESSADNDAVQVPLSTTPAAEAEKPEISSSTIKLDTEIKFAGVPPLDVTEKREARDRLRAVDREELLKQRREEARNTLEAYLYRVRDLLDDPSDETPFKKCSQPEEREAISEKVEETVAWLHNKGDLAETSQLYDKRNVIETLERPIIHRYQEIEAFPQALNNSQMWNWSTRIFLTEAYQNLTEEEKTGAPSKWTREELGALEKTLREHEQWLNEWVEKQKSVKMNEDPVIETTEMKARAKTLEVHLQKLVKRKIRKPRQPTSTSTSTTATATKSGSDPITTPNSAAEDVTSNAGAGAKDEMEGMEGIFAKSKPPSPPPADKHDEL